MRESLSGSNWSPKVATVAVNLAASQRVDARPHVLIDADLPFGDVAENGQGKWSFAKGSLTWGKVRLLNNHDWSQVLGIADLADPAVLHERQHRQQKDEQRCQHFGRRGPIHLHGAECNTGKLP